MMLLYVSLFCTGLFVSMNAKGMLLVPVANFLSTYLPEWICNPLFECIICMGSFWTLIAWVLWNQSISWWIVPAIFVVCGINSIISVIIKPLFDE